MFRPEFMSRSLTFLDDAEHIALPLVPSNQGGFAGLFGEVQGEVANFIENGSASSPASSLSAEGGLHRTPQQAGLSTASTGAGVTEQSQQAFLESIAPFAQKAAQRLGVSTDVIAAQAALESGWGQRPLRQSDGNDTHNLFAIKAGSSWHGMATEAQTTEYENGSTQNRTERFRSYPDNASAFRDFSQMLLDNPRYHAALNTGGDANAYAQGLVRGGYATDPAYADKLVRLATRIHSGN